MKLQTLYTVIMVYSINTLFLLLIYQEKAIKKQGVQRQKKLSGIPISRTSSRKENWFEKSGGLREIGVKLHAKKYCPREIKISSRKKLRAPKNLNSAALSKGNENLV